MLEFRDPSRSLDSVSLPGNLGETVRELLTEWTQSAKLARYGISPRNRVLLYGPPGNGKTTLAEVIAVELGVSLAVAQYGEMLDAYQNNSQRNLALAFDKARRRKCVLFFDEADAICSKRGESEHSQDMNRTVNQLLVQLDKMPAENVVIFATNFDQQLDPAMKRRINLKLEMPAPSLADLRKLLAVIRKRNPMWPLSEFNVETCGAISFAELEGMVLDHARRVILSTDDPLGTAGKPRSAWLRERLEETKRERELFDIGVKS